MNIVERAISEKIGFDAALNLLDAIGHTLEVEDLQALLEYTYHITPVALPALAKGISELSVFSKELTEVLAHYFTRAYCDMPIKKQRRLNLKWVFANCADEQILEIAAHIGRTGESGNYCYALHAEPRMYLFSAAETREQIEGLADMVSAIKQAMRDAIKRERGEA